MEFIAAIIAYLIGNTLLGPVGGFFAALIGYFFGRGPSLSRAISVGIIAGIAVNLIAFFLIPFFVIAIISSLLYLAKSALFPKKNQQTNTNSYNGGYSDSGSTSNGQPLMDEERENLFLATASAMMAKIAKADGRISQTEINTAERVFRKMGLSPKKREFCIEHFRAAKNDSFTIFDYASKYTQVEPNTNLRVILYDITWDIATADGMTLDNELKILRELPRYLNISPLYFTYQYARRMNRGGYDSYGGAYGRYDNSGSSASRESELEEAYAIIGVSSTASDDEVKKAYRDKAKQNHPDILVNKGVPREKAYDQMAQINTAWDKIKKARDL